MAGRPSTQEVVFGGLMAALTIALAAPLGPVLPSVLALPVALAYARHGLRSALWTALVATGGCLALYDLVTVTALIIPSGILAGLALGWGAWHRRPALQTVGLATAANVAGFAADWYLGVLVLHQDPGAQWQQGITSWLGSVHNLAPQLDAIARALEPYLRRGIPAAALAYSLLMAAAAYMVAFIVFRRIGHPLEAPQLAAMRLPWWAAVLLGLSYLPAYIPLSGRTHMVAQGFSINLQLLLYLLFALQGLLVAVVLAHGSGLGRAGALLGVIILLVARVAPFVGVADSLVDLRGRLLPRRAG